MPMVERVLPWCERWPDARDPAPYPIVPGCVLKDAYECDGSPYLKGDFQLSLLVFYCEQGTVPEFDSYL